MSFLHGDALPLRMPDEAAAGAASPVDTGRQAIWFVELVPTERVTYVAPAYERIWGRPAADLYGAARAWCAAIHAEDRPRVEAAHAHWMAMPGQAGYDVEFRIERGDGLWRWIRSVGHCVDAGPPNARQLVHVAEDVTEQRLDIEELRHVNSMLERRLRERSADLDRAVKEIEAFSYSISHDLRAPLRALDGFSLALSQDCATELSETGQRYVGIIRQSAQKMGQLIDGLLAFSRLGRQPLHRQKADTELLVRNALERLAPLQAGRRIDLRIGPMPPSAADLGMLQQVWIHLLANALKYTRARSPALIEIGATIVETPAGTAPEYFVRDNGVGFDRRYTHKLFGIFQRLHRAEDYEGTGVGLAIVQRIVVRHGGQIRAEGDSGKGAAFYFTLGEP